MKALITITTCNRLPEVQKYIWEYLNFVNKNDDFHFVLALDGKEQAYIDFCEKYDIPLVYSDEREGVGLSKNRVLTQFPNYDYYFFIEDDIELIDDQLFQLLINISNSKSIHHLCTNHSWNKIKMENYADTQLLYATTGGATFAFYTKKGLIKVGGFHTLFAKYRRFGHTEHSYRFVHAGLQEAPFIYPTNFTKYFLIHSPIAVTRNLNISTNENQLIEEEQDLIDEKTSYFPLQTIYPFYFNKKKLGYNAKVDSFLNENPQHYPLTKGKERKKALGEYYALMINRKNNTFFKNFTLAIKSMWLAPMNNELKHKIKHYFK